MNLGVNRSQNNGNRLENWVFGLLDQTFDDVTYLTDPREIDFRLRDMLVQVSYDISDDATRRREIGALAKHTGQKILITYDTAGEERDVTILPVERFVFEYCM